MMIILNPKFQGPKWRTFRLATFISTGLSAILPLGHGLMIFGIDAMNKQSGLPYYLIEGLIHIMGATVYLVSNEYD
jgi:adiponectin receptor